MPRPPMLSKSVVAGFKRERVMRATADTVAGLEYRHATVADIVRRAGVARNTFYELFGGKEAAFEATVGWIVERALREVEESEDPLAAIVDFVHSQPEDARCVLVEAQCALPALYEAHLAEAAQRLGLEEPVAMMVAGGVASILYRCVVGGGVYRFGGPARVRGAALRDASLPLVEAQQARAGDPPRAGPGTSPPTSPGMGGDVLPVASSR